MKKILRNRYQFARDLIPEKTSSLLDVGCRDAILKSYLPVGIGYSGADIFDGPGVDHVCDLESGLPFQDGAYDVVTALDVLEHTDNIWASFEELVRVASKSIIIVLPNLYHWSLRLQYLSGKEMGKYRLSPEPVVDRHRWLLSYDAACKFSHLMATKHNMTLDKHTMYGPRRYIPVDLLLNSLSKNLGVWSVAFVFSK